jgi:glycosyltransferase involved in cell wall biosynthesis
MSNQSDALPAAGNGAVEAGERVAAGGSGAGTDGVVFVATLGHGSMDRYSQKLAEHLPAVKLETDIYQRSAECFGVGLLSGAALTSFRVDVAFIRELRDAEAEILHFPNHHLGRYGVFLGRPYLVTVHDLIRYFDLNGLGPFIHRPNMRDRICLRLDYAGVGRATALIAVSETTKRDLCTHLGIPEDRVFVVYEGVDHAVFRPLPGRPLKEPYLLFVGSEHPRKNLRTVLRAFAILKREPRFRELKLLKIGSAGGREGPFRARTQRALAEVGLERDVVFREGISDEELARCYSNAACLVLPSLYEGFGFPPLEAMACGCPVVVSTAGSLPEIAADAGLLVEAHDAAALADAVRRTLSEEATRKELIGRGLRRAAEFSWERTARETTAVYATVRRRGLDAS